ncbi:hypothetical protein JKA74_19925 [Marivirga sp. S37H4]|uniref:Golvesin/Xly CBD-like domain-containing protein n=1 Tax=Marivirga aurantiaca TaxID=2802615 RepID=A0A934X2K8_9BACT|nr:hypothetical protein [Marivirga aurantiaca]MBK6267321.1 hypothetical protein [Marivirga aurantiaca]
MISIKNILTISRFESKVLWRNWFFRILAVAGIGFLSLLFILEFSEVNTPDWDQLSNSWMMPYAGMILISIPQVAAVIFLATGLIKKDKKVDTNEVFFVRPITNLDYVLGKALALFKLFFLLNMVLVCIPLIINITNPYTTFNPLAYIVYPLLTSIPTIIFTTGVAFLAVTLLKNQPITIVLLLGIAGVQLIYYFDQFSNILDFMAFRLPMYISEISGFADMEFALWQRAFYLITGVACLFITAIFLDRLSSHRVAIISTAVIGVVFLGISSFIMLRLWDMRQEPIKLRQEMITVNGKWADVPNVDIVSNAIDLEWLGSSISATSEMVVRNINQQPLEKVYFTLNPGLIVDEVLVGNKPLEFKRNQHIISLEQGFTLAPNQEVKVLIKYHGSIKESAAHLEVDQKRFESAREYFVHSMQKKYAFLQPDYVLLTKDVFWYPDIEIGYSSKSPRKARQSFIDFQLKVKTAEGKMAISQGDPVIKGDTYEFNPEYPLPQISLAIGDYVKKEILVDSITYAVYHYPKNDYFLKELDQLQDTLSYLITDLVNEYEDAQKLSYPFKRLNFVEAPISFMAYNKVYESHQAYLQPETVYWPEEGGNISQFDLRRQKIYMDKQANAQNQVLTDKQKQANVFNDLIKKIFTGQIGAEYVFDGYHEDVADYSLFPNYYDYNAGIVSREWTLLNRSIATYLKNEKPPQTDYSRNKNGISFTEECNNLMRESSLQEILSGAEFNKIQKSVSLKSQYLFSYIGQLVGENNFKTFLYNWLNAHQHQLTHYEELREALISEFSLDIDPIIRKVYSESDQAAYEILDIQKYEVLDGDRKRYQLLIKVKNSGENDGVLEVKFNTGGNLIANQDDDDVFLQKVNKELAESTARNFVLRQGETKLLGFVMDEKPNNITLNTIISKNIPSEIVLAIGPLTKREGGALFEGERVIIEEKASNLYEIIVDNEDSEFSSFSPIKPTYLKAYLDSRKTTEQKYYGSWDRPYSSWQATTGSEFYGTVIRSAHFTRSGNGEKVATWTPEIKEEGFYDIYTYMKGKNQNEFRGKDGDNKQFYYHYTIQHADGADNITYNISNAEPGWNFLGSYYFNQNGGSVSLSDECGLRTVYADAIKWVKQ